MHTAIRGRHLVVVVLFGLAASAPVMAGKPKPVTVTNFPPTQDVNVVGGCTAGRFLGFTSTQLAGNVGLFRFVAACGVDFPGSRICSTTSIARETSPPAGLSGDAWILPELVSAGGGTLFDGVSGVLQNFGNLTCSGWSAQPGALGMVVDSQGRFGLGDCMQARAVACCEVP